MTDKEVVSLREYIDTKFHMQEKLFESKSDAAEKATILAKAEIDRRLEGMNEFREQLSKQADSFITRSDFANHSKEIESLKLSRAELSGKASQVAVNISYLISGICILLTIVSFFLK